MKKALTFGEGVRRVRSFQAPCDDNTTKRAECQKKIKAPTGRITLVLLKKVQCSLIGETMLHYFFESKYFAIKKLGMTMNMKLAVRSSLLSLMAAAIRGPWR